MNTLRTIIVPASMIEAARQLAREISSAGEGMFLTPLSITGEAPATHYVSSGQIDERFALAMNSGAYLHGAAVAGAEAQGITKVATEQEAVDLVAQTFVAEKGVEYIAEMGFRMAEETLS